MAGFSASDAAFEGFRLTREKPGAVLAWGVFYMLAVIAIVLVLLLAAGGGLAAFEAFSDAADPESLSRAIAGMGPVLLLAVPLVLLTIAMLVAAMYRAVLEPGRPGLAYLRLGGDELRLALLFAILGLIWGAVIVVAATAVAALAALAPEGPRGLLTLITVVAAICAVIWIGVRLSLAGPQTLVERRLQIGAAWQLTKGRFWSLFGAYALALVFSIIIGVLGAIISIALLAVLGGGVGAIGQANDPDFSSFSPGLAVGFLFYTLVQFVTAVLQMIIQTVPPAAAYRQISPSNEAEVFA